MSGLNRRQFLTVAASATVLGGCADTAADPKPVVLTTESTTKSPTATPPRTPEPPPHPAKIHANELGMIPVLMHHRLVTSSAGTYDMTPAFFRAELDRLHRENYYPIRTIDLVRRELSSVPAGKTPVVLTFDDSTPGQVAFDSAGRVTPDCALGILQDFHAHNPDFPAVASFYINKNPFGLTGAAATSALVRLHQLGCEIGNHTWSHPNLRKLTSSQAEQEIGKLAALVTKAVPQAPPTTMALPLGVHPRQPAVLARGGTGVTAYRNLGVLLVGAAPSHSPFHRDFDPMAIPRIRCSSGNGGKGQLELAYWLDRLADKPELKYVAAGNPGHGPDPGSSPRSR